MTAPLPLPAQIRAVQTARNIIATGTKPKHSERELMDERLRAVERTLAYLRRHEDEFRKFMAWIDGTTRKEGPQ